MEIDRKNSEVIQRVSEKFPEIKELKSKLHKSSGKKAEKIIRDMNKLAARAAEIPEDMIQKMHEKIEEEKDRIRKEKNEFLGRLNSSPATYFSKILDILYLGQGKVTFSPDYVGGIGIFDFNEGDNILRLVIGGDCTFSGFKKVHLKAETADLDLQDPRVEGVFHIMKGNVRVRYESSTYGGIIRVKTQSPDSVRTEGFARKGDLFVPEAFAKGRVWNNKPAVEIAVKEGYVSLVLTSPSYHTSYDFAYYDSIRNKKKSIEKSDLESIISYEKYNKSKYYR
jgi:hypothetical protein